MTTALEKLGTVSSADVLIVGSGIAGLAAAISSKEQAPAAKVLVVEKNTSGWAGQANKGAGVFMHLGPGDSVERFLDYHTHSIGMFLEDQELLEEFARDSLGTIERLDSWCRTFCRNADGTLITDTFKPGLPWHLAAAEIDTQMKAQRYAKKLGVEFMDKTMIVDLLKDGGGSGGGRVAGAIGFSLLDGSSQVFPAKAVILATGGQSYRILSMWNGARGDGIAAAYRAGAQMRNAEFGSFMQLIQKRSKEPLLGAEDALYNAKGEYLSERWRSQFDPDIDAMTGAVWYREMMAGKGPLVTHNDENWLLQHTTRHTEKGGHGDDTPELWNRPKAEAFWGRLLSKAAAADGRGPVSEVFPGVIGEFSPVKVDHRMATTVPGLFAVGNAATSGCAMAGAVPASPGRIRGKALTSSTWMGIRAGGAALEYAAGVSRPGPNVDLAEVCREEMLRPLARAQRGQAGVAPLELVHAIQATISPVGYSIYKSKERMEEALSLVLEAKARTTQLTASDPHHLAAANEARSMVLCAEMFYRASLARTESRGWHLREDFPDRDDAHWLSWILLEEKDGEMAISTERVPLERYAVKP